MRLQPMFGTDNELHHLGWLSADKVNAHLQSNFGNDNDAKAHDRSQHEPCCSVIAPIGRMAIGKFPRAAASFHLIYA